MKRAVTKRIKTSKIAHQKTTRSEIARQNRANGSKQKVCVTTYIDKDTYTALTKEMRKTKKSRSFVVSQALRESATLNLHAGYFKAKRNWKRI